MARTHKQGDKEPMTRFDDHGYERARWYWKICEHDKLHNGCVQLGDGLCGVKAIRYKVWNCGKWEAEPMVNHATPEQEQVLDNR